MALKVRTFKEGGKVSQVQVEEGDDIFAVRKKKNSYEFQVAGRRAVGVKRSALREFIAGLQKLID